MFVNVLCLVLVQFQFRLKWTSSSCRSDSRLTLCVSADGQRRCECLRVSSVRPHQSHCQLITQRTPAVTPTLCPVWGSASVKVHNEPDQICQSESAPVCPQTCPHDKETVCYYDLIFPQSTAGVPHNSKNNDCGAPFSSVGRAASYVEALSSLQRTRFRLPSRVRLLRVTRPLSSCFLSHLQLNYQMKP